MVQQENLVVELKEVLKHYTIKKVEGRKIHIETTNNRLNTLNELKNFLQQKNFTTKLEQCSDSSIGRLTVNGSGFVYVKPPNQQTSKSFGFSGPGEDLIVETIKKYLPLKKLVIDGIYFNNVVDIAHETGWFQGEAKTDVYIVTKQNRFNFSVKLHNKAPSYEGISRLLKFQPQYTDFVFNCIKEYKSYWKTNSYVKDSYFHIPKKMSEFAVFGSEDIGGLVDYLIYFDPLLFSCNFQKNILYLSGVKLKNEIPGKDWKPYLLIRSRFDSMGKSGISKMLPGSRICIAPYSRCKSGVKL